MKFAFLKRTILAFLLFALTILWGATGYSIYGSREEQKQLARVENERFADALSAYTDLVFQSIENRLKDTAQHYYNAADLSPLDPDVTQLLGQWAQDTKGIASINLFSPDGTMVQSGITSGPGKYYAPPKMLNFKERPYFRHYSDNWTTERQDEFFIGSPVKSKITNRWIIPIAYPRIAQDDTFPGLVVTALLVENFNSFFSASELNQEQSIAILKRNGDVLFMVPGLENVIGKNYAQGVLFTKYLPSADKGSYETKVIVDGKERLVSYRTLEHYPLVVAVAKLSDKVLDTWRKQAISNIIIASLISMFLIIFFMIVRRQANALEVHGSDLALKIEERTHDLQAALVDAQSADKAKSEFLSTVSHELRTPLTSIKGSLGLITAGTAGELPQKAQSLAGLALTNTNRLINLVNDILDIEKLLSGTVTLNMETLDVTELVNQGIEENQGYAIEHNVTFVLIDNAPHMNVTGDHQKLIQVISNLLSNAAKFSPDQGNVEIIIDKNADRVRISIKDFGAGIPEHFHDKVFQRFAQADTSDSREKSGTGLGLNICWSIIEKHGGLIDFTTQREQGTTFFFELQTLEAI
ncbi:MAG: ATP-binding protein [Magnetovibrio sp.]|nr:ATP-binding protein [Magnetovibrio sp.]